MLRAGCDQSVGDFEEMVENAMCGSMMRPGNDDFLSGYEYLCLANGHAGFDGMADLEDWLAGWIKYQDALVERHSEGWGGSLAKAFVSEVVGPAGCRQSIIAD